MRWGSPSHWKRTTRSLAWLVEFVVATPSQPANGFLLYVKRWMKPVYFGSASGIPVYLPRSVQPLSSKRARTATSVISHQLIFLPVQWTILIERNLKWHQNDLSNGLWDIPPCPQRTVVIHLKTVSESRRLCRVWSRFAEIFSLLSNFPVKNFKFSAIETVNCKNASWWMVTDAAARVHLSYRGRADRSRTFRGIFSK